MLLPELKVKLIQFLIGKQKSDGYTIIELLVVIMMVGILFSIALPSFMNQTAKAKQAEAQQTLGSAIRAQQAYRLEHPQFATTMGDLAIGVKTTSVHYQFTDVGNTNSPSGAGTPGKFNSPTTNFSESVSLYANAEDFVSVRNYATAAYTYLQGDGIPMTMTVICESEKPGKAATPPNTMPAIGTTSIGCQVGNPLQ